MAALLGVVFLLVLWVALFAGALLGIIGAFDMVKKTPADPVAFLIEKMKGGGGHAEGAHGDDHGSQKTNIIIWVALLGLTIFEVVLAYIHIPLVLMLIVLMGLSLVKAALIMAFFMHLKFERLSFVLTVVPATVFRSEGFVDDPGRYGDVLLLALGIGEAQVYEPRLGVFDQADGVGGCHGLLLVRVSG